MANDPERAIGKPALLLTIFPVEKSFLVENQAEGFCSAEEKSVLRGQDAL